MDSDIVISGISGKFPESENVAEFSENLYSKKDMMTESSKRWEPGLYGLPKRLGQLKDISRFDAGFFGVHHKQAALLDPQVRIFLELTHECIVDAGYDPADLRGKKIGVFIGNSSSESDEFFCKDPKKVNGYSMTGCCRAMFANRISYTFDFKGPSFVMDTACSSGALALHEAVTSMRNNFCDAAFVGGANLCLRPATSIMFNKLNMLSPDGKCKSFDSRGNGYGRSEAIVGIFLQRANAARRIYATVVHVKTNTDGSKEQGITFPSAEIQKRLIREVYEDCKLDPLNVSYVEAHGTGTPAGDPIEMSAISDILCKGRKDPLLIGCVKTNMGHPEPTSGLCSITKVIISMENKCIPPNLHFENPNPNIPALMEGKVKIITEPTKWEGGYASTSCFGFGGVNVHTVLKSHSSNPRQKVTVECQFPQLALYCGRTEESVDYLFKYLDENKVKRDFFGLLHKSVYPSLVLKPFRGYKVLDPASGVSDIKHVTCAEKRPVWYIFSGMGTQWPGMAKDLMQLEVFANSIRKSAEVLKPHGIDLIELVMNGISTEKKRAIIPAFVSIAAVQVALVDVLNELGIEPDGMVGHSVGELGCAYADGCFTGEQMVLAAYMRGKAVEDSNLIEGSMAALGLTWAQAKERCPDGVYPSCHNASDSVSISGTQKGVHDFVEKLKAESVFAREVDSCGYAFHSKYIHPAAEKLQLAMEKVIPKPKVRTARWISSSFPEQEWNEARTKLAGADYFVHNLVSPVLFHEALRHVPKDAIVIEIAPHHLLQAILKRVIGPDAEYIGLMKRNTNNAVHLLSSIGRLYTSGLNPQIENLYPPVSFPVAPGTPMIAPLIKWDHSESWLTACWLKGDAQGQMIIDVNIGSPDSGDDYISGHVIDGKCLYPAAGYINLVWKAFAELKNRPVEKLPVVFENVKIHRATVLSKTNVTKLLVDITSAGGEFEISEAGTTVATGRISAADDSLNTMSPSFKGSWLTDEVKLDSKDIYKELRLRGYDYGPTFQGVLESDMEGNKGLLKWTGNWVVFLDNMLQFMIVGSDKRALCVPTRIPNIKINPLLHACLVSELPSPDHGVPVVHEKRTSMCAAGGIEMTHLKSNIIARQPNRQIPLLEEYSFVPYDETSVIPSSEKETINNYVHVCSTISKKILEFAGKNKEQIIDVMNGFLEVGENVISEYLSELSSSRVLLKTLQNIMENAKPDNFTKIVSAGLQNYLDDQDEDLLHRSLKSEIPLRNVLDIITENSSSKLVKFLEVCETRFPLTMEIRKMFQNFSMHNASCTVAHPKPDIIVEEALSSGDVKTVSWSLSAKSSPDAKDVDVVVVKNINCGKKELKNSLQKLSSIVRDWGFVLVLQRTRLIPAELFLSAVSEIAIPVHTEAEMEKAFKDLNLVTVCKKSDSLVSSMYLLRKLPSKVSFTDTIVNVKTGSYDSWVEQLKNILSDEKAPKDRRIWLVAEGDPTSGIIGLVNCIKQEPGGENIRCMFIDSSSRVKPPKFKINDSFYKGLVEKNLLMNIFKNGVWGSYRHVSITNEKKAVLSEHAYLNVLTRGDLTSLQWIDSPLKYFPSSTSSSSVLCHVYYAPLNFRDVMLASGKLPPDAIPGDLALQDCILGLEFSGRDKSGKRIMGLVPAKGLATTVAANREFLWDVPDNWTLEEASTVPVAYSTAYYALVTRGHLQQGERVLIHSGSGGVGQAAISIALSRKCEVYTSVGSTEKKEYLKKLFPQLTEKNFCNSRDLTFERHILNNTNGEGVDVVLNSLADEKLKASLNCLAQHGRFLEIGKYDLSNNTPLGMAIFLKNVAFHGILLDALFEKPSTMREVQELVTRGIKEGTVKPLNTILFNFDQAEQAFRYMASGRHIGKVVLRIKEEERQKQTVPTPIKMSVLPRTSCDPKKSYIIIGGLGGFGLELCHWLIDRGAKTIILTSRSGVRSGYQHLCLKRWKVKDINVITSKLNASIYEDAQKLLKLASQHAPVGGIFNLALVLRDAFMTNQTAENYKLVCESKVQSTVNMDELSRSLCPELEYFVCFSSVSCGRGNAGQSNYGFANSVMERVCEKRNSEGLCGLAIQWGAIGDVGVIQDTVGGDVVIGGTVPQRITSCLNVLDSFLTQTKPVVSSFVPYQPSDTSIQKTSKKDITIALANVFGIKDASTINMESTLAELGMDSLMGVEIQQFIERNYDISLSIQDLRQMKIRDLKRLDSGGSDSKEGSSDSNNKSDNNKEFQSLETSIREIAYVEFNNIVPRKTIIPLNKNTEGDPVFIVHPIEGFVHMLEPLGKLIKNPVYGLQCTPEAPSSSIEDLGIYYLEQIKAMNVGNNIHVAGYSFGASVAFEMALQVESKQVTGVNIKQLFMLDGSPALVTAYTREHESHFTVNATSEGEAQSLAAFALHFTDVNLKDFKESLMALPTLKDRVELTTDFIVTSCPTVKKDDVSAAFNLYYRKLMMSMKYTAKRQLRRDLTLIRASNVVSLLKSFSDKYDLEKVCCGEVKMHIVEGNHKTFIQGHSAKEVSKIVNGMLVQ